MAIRIMLVEDESIVAMEIEGQLRRSGYDPLGICATADEAYAMAMEKEVDVILMDIELIDSNGIDAAERIKSVRDIPIIFLTAYMDDATIQRAIAVDPAAYLTKPYTFPELTAAIQIAHSKHTVQATPSEHTSILDSEFAYHHDRAELTQRGKTIHLTKKEKALLEIFLSHPNCLISHETVEYAVWPEEPVSDNTRRILLSRLRSKLKHKFIESYSMEGYIFRMDS